MSYKAVFKETGTGDTGPSPEIWGGMDIPRMKSGDLGYGYLFEDDFLDWGLPGTQTTEINLGRYKVFNTGSGLVTVTTTVNSVVVPGGILGIGVDTANDSGSIAVNQPSFYLKGTTAGKRLAFEARVAYSPIVTNGLGWILGLGEASLWTLATGVPLNGGDAPTNSGAFIGFQKPEDDTTTFNSCYVDRDTTMVAIGDGEGTYATAFAFTKLGFVYDPVGVNSAGDNLVFYQDGAELTSGRTNAEIAACTYLDAGLLSPMLAIVADTAGTSGLFYMDWWRCAQLR